MTDQQLQRILVRLEILIFLALNIAVHAFINTVNQ